MIEIVGLPKPSRLMLHSPGDLLLAWYHQVLDIGIGQRIWVEVFEEPARVDVRRYRPNMPGSSTAFPWNASSVEISQRDGDSETHALFRNPDQLWYEWGVR